MRSSLNSLTLPLGAPLSKILALLAPRGRVRHWLPTFVAFFHYATHMLMFPNAGTFSLLFPSRWWTRIGTTERPDGTCQRATVTSKSKPLPGRHWRTIGGPKQCISPDLLVRGDFLSSCPVV